MSKGKKSFLLLLKRGQKTTSISHGTHARPHFRKTITAVLFLVTPRDRLHRPGLVEQRVKGGDARLIVRVCHPLLALSPFLLGSAVFVPRGRVMLFPLFPRAEKRKEKDKNQRFTSPGNVPKHGNVCFPNHMGLCRLLELLFWSILFAFARELTRGPSLRQQILSTLQ